MAGLVLLLTSLYYIFHYNWFVSYYRDKNKRMLPEWSCVLVIIIFPFWLISLLIVIFHAFTN